MPTSRSKPVAKKRRHRPSVALSDDAPSPGGIEAFPCVVEGNAVTHVILPIGEYERLIESGMVREALDHRDDSQDQFVNAWELGLQLAGERIAAARKAAGLTQKQLGHKLGLPQSQISCIEKDPDRTTVRTLKRVAKALNADVGSLID